MTSTTQVTPSGAAVLPAPWGSPPTPLLPAWYRQELSSVPLPPALRQTGVPSATSKTRLLTIGDLATCWEHRSTPLSNRVLAVLVDLVKHVVPPGHHVVLPPGVDTARLLECPLRTRTRNCLQRAILRGVLREGQTTTVTHVLALPNFGITALLELMCVTEVALDSGFLGEDTTTTTLAADALPAAAPDAGQVAWDTATTLLAKIFGVANRFRGARTLGDALNVNLGELASTLELTAALDEIPIPDLTGGPTLVDEVLSALIRLRESLPPVEQLILEQRLYASEPLTLEEIGRTTDLSRERIRQLQKRLESAVESAVGRRMEIIAALVHQQLAPVISASELEERVLSTYPGTTGPNGAEPPTELARHMLRAELDYSCIGGICLSKEAAAVLEELQSAAHDLADDVGLVEESDLQARLRDDGWHPHWEALLARCELHRFSGHLALRDTAKARTKAALLAIGRPATSEEVAALCGLDRGRVGGQLSLLPDVVRADKVRWGLAGWIEDEYEGIPAEIIQRIHEDGGATTLQRLLEELPRMFGVNEGSVRSYAGTPRFELRDGYVSLADESSIALRSLDDVMHGRDVDGAHYWTFKVEDRYFDGYSLVGLPPEIAKTLGCEPNGRTRVRVSYPDDCSDLSVNWRLASMSGASLGYLSEPLRKLGVQDGDRVRLVLDRPGYVSLHRGSPDNAVPSEPHDPDAPSQHPSSEGSSSDDRAREFLERMKNRRRGL